MLVILEATAGPLAGRKIEVRAGTIVRIGRTPKSDYALGEDSYLSSQHFAVECDGIQCRIRDLGSSNGTFVNGERVSEIVVREGDSVMAGGSTFAIHIEAASASAAAPASATAPVPTATFPGGFQRPEAPGPMITGEVRLEWPGFSRPQSSLLSALFKDDLHVYAVVDASRDSRIPAFLDASGESYASLDPDMKVPAFMVHLPRESRLLDVLIKDGWSHGWGFYCATSSAFDELCAHWRNYLTLHTEDGRKLTFRFWDPRVMRALVPMMSAQEGADFFGPVGRLLVEAGKPEIGLEITLTPRGSRQRNVVLV